MAGKYLIDIITGYQTSKLAVLFLVMVGGQVFSLLFEMCIRDSIYSSKNITV